MKTTQKSCQVCGNTEINSKMKICPKCGGKLPTPFYKKWWFWLIIVLGVLIIAGAGSTSDEESTQDTSSPIVDNNSDSQNSTVKYTKVDLQQMLDELEENALKAEKNYNNAYIEVTGKIAGFDSDGSYITIEPSNASEWNFYTVICYIKNDEQLDYLLEKSKGDKVTIKGQITSVGEVLGYSLKIDYVE